MTLWTVMFGDNPLSTPAAKKSHSVRVKIFNSRRTAYGFRDLCMSHGVYADVVYHPNRYDYQTLH